MLLVHIQNITLSGILFFCRFSFSFINTEGGFIRLAYDQVIAVVVLQYLLKKSVVKKNL